MNKIHAAITVVAAILLAWSGSVCADVQVIARVDGLSSATETVIPVYEYLQDGDGQDYALVLASRSALDASGYTYRIIDTDAGLKSYALALRFGKPSTADQPQACNVVGRGWGRGRPGENVE